VKISVTGIANKLGIAHVVSKRPECIPKTIQILKKYAESTEEFIVRRVRFLADSFIREKTLVTYTQLIKRAHLMQPHLLQLPKVQHEIIASLSRIKDAYDSGWSHS
jgi:hypothetical protein